MSTQCCFRTPSYVLVTCNVSLAVGVSFTISDSVQAVEPEIVQEGFDLGTEGVYDHAPSTTHDYYLTVDGATLQDYPPLPPFGIWWRCGLRTPQRYLDVYGDTGTWCYVQLIDGWNGHMTVAGPPSASYHDRINGLTGLDTDYPYPYPGGHVSANGYLHNFQDQPGIPLSGETHASLDDSFSVYRMYLPPGDGSSYVPHHSIDWYNSGAAFLSTANAWTLTYPNQGTSASTDAPPHPMGGLILSPGWVAD